MKIKATQIVSALSVIAILQLMFFWIVPMTKSFAAVYPFYTALTVAHVALSAYFSQKYKFQSCFIAILIGGFVVLGEVVGGILMGVLCDSLRTVLFVESIITIAYVFVITLLISISAKEAVASDVQTEPVVEFSSNFQQMQRSNTTVADTERKPRAVKTSGT